MSNLAYDYSYQESKETYSKTVKKNNTIQKSKTSAKKLAMNLRVGGIAVLVCLLSVLAVNDMQTLSSIKASIESVKKANNQIVNEISTIESNIAKLRGEKRIEDEAMAKLGMIYPTEENKVYINSMEESTKTDKTKGKSFNLIGALFK